VRDQSSLRPRIEAERLEGRVLLALFTVTSSADSGRDTLRDAITSANADPATLDEIDFNIFRVTSIQLASALPTITGPVVIDGSTQPNYAGTPLIQLDGSSAGASSNGLTIAATGCVIKGLCIRNFGGDGIRITTGGDTIWACRIGTSANGTTDQGNGGSGIFLSTANNNTIGGTIASERNLLSGNQKMGIYISGSSGNLIEGNYIGTNAAGNAALPNGSSGDVDGFGIYVIPEGSLPSNNNSIGGSVAGAGNLISGNPKSGVYLTGAAANNGIAGNLIGTDATGTSAIPNNTGVAIGGSTGNTIGGTIEGARNIISGNTSHGISLNTFNYNVGDTIQGNYIGTNLTGTAAIPNHGDGIHVESGSYVIGGIASNGHFPGNLISGNLGNGIQLGGEETSGNSIIGNAIGTAADRVTALGNAIDGILITYGDMFSAFQGPASNNAIGGATAASGNVIAFNSNIGVEVSGVGPNGPLGETLTGNLIRRNSIFSNGQLGIDLVGTGPSPNDINDVDTEGGNLGQNYPIITAAGGNSGTTVRGILDSAPSQPYTIDFYSSPDRDPSGYGEGKNWLGSTPVTTGANGEANFTVSLSSLVPGTFITATATDSANNTSEFSAAHAVDITPPKVIDAVFAYDEEFGSVNIRFNEDVGSSIDYIDIQVEDLTHHVTYNGNSFQRDYARQGNLLTLHFRPTTVPIPFHDANYRLTLIASGINDFDGNSLDGDGNGTAGGDFIFNFFALAGDANHDRIVDVTDLGVLASNWQGTHAWTFSQGDFNYDFKVDVSDLGILATNWQKSLPALSLSKQPAPSPSAAPAAQLAALTAPRAASIAPSRDSDRLKDSMVDVIDSI
jgi:parallel beta-helix repeat protein